MLDGEWIVYVCNYMDIMEDCVCGNFWILSIDGFNLCFLILGMYGVGLFVWFLSGDCLLFILIEIGSV